jgi:hypothetical protein
MSTARSTIALSAFALLALNCGALGAPARGDRDLPSTVLGGYAAVALQSSPTGSALLLSADDGSLDEPTSLLEPDGRRAVYATHTTNAGAVRIARAIERHPRYLRFEPIQTVLEAALPWEQGAVRSPSVLRDRSTVWLFYAAGGAIGAARSSDGITFNRESEPVLRADSAHGEGAAIGAPSVAAHPSGGFVMAYASGGSLFLARAQQLPGPWVRVGMGAAITPSAVTDAGLESLTDPALLIERTSTGRELVAIAASSTATGVTTSVVGFAAWDTGEAEFSFSRAARTLYGERTTSVSAGSFDRVDARTMLLWVSRNDRTRSIIGALVTPGGQRASNPFVP